MTAMVHIFSGKSSQTLQHSTGSPMVSIGELRVGIQIEVVFPSQKVLIKPFALSQSAIATCSWNPFHLFKRRLYPFIMTRLQRKHCKVVQSSLPLVFCSNAYLAVVFFFFWVRGAYRFVRFTVVSHAANFLGPSRHLS